MKHDNSLCPPLCPLCLRGERLPRRRSPQETQRTQRGAQRKTSFLILIILAASIFTSINVGASNETEVRATVERVFQDLKSKNYDALYETLPANTRARMSRERFTASLRRAQDNYALDRIEIGKVRASGNIAIVDTVLY